MRCALAAELAEVRRIARHYFPLGRVLRVSAEFVAVASMVGAVTLYGIASTTSAPKGAIMIAEAGR
jgi:hypothetical protein